MSIVRNVIWPHKSLSGNLLTGLIKDIIWHIAEEARLDLLINNAGVMRCKKSYTKESIELQLGTNHMGHFLLTHLLLDKLKASVPSRVVNVSSVAHERGKINFADLNSAKNYDEGEAYAQSKLANILFTRELAERLAGSGVTCNAVHPGLVYTDIGRHMSINKSWLAMFVLHPFLWLFLKTPRQGAQTIVHAALSPDLAEVTGKYFRSSAETCVSTSYLCLWDSTDSVLDSLEPLGIVFLGDLVLFLHLYWDFRDIHPIYSVIRDGAFREQRLVQLHLEGVHREDEVGDGKEEVRQGGERKWNKECSQDQ
ncbi:Retinol dehydrogenase 13 [Portunus trituberculatus]|uniref:Retinol dehydrogenase 13 n=1 Tax=Portunus trituberculatus TaxID=210409 RepID=A0A5B7DMQ3_PORTR|nr:Retinol dehydrogenase 13 [Portunus trituberculatus]